MLTLKVITIDTDDDRAVTLYSADHISHFATIEKRKDLPNKFPSAQRVGTLADSSSDQELIISHVILWNGDRSIKEDLLILPKSDCFIMEEGKTVDTFYSYFKE
jgi:hypothetical protein